MSGQWLIDVELAAKDANLFGIGILEREVKLPSEIKEASESGSSAEMLMLPCHLPRNGLRMVLDVGDKVDFCQVADPIADPL